jgi:2-isopropylmalate synthase
MTGVVTLQAKLRVGDDLVDVEGRGNGPIAAFLDVLAHQGIEVKLYDYVEHALSASGDALAASYVELEVNGRRLWGVGIDGDSSTASLKAIVSSVNRAIRAEIGDQVDLALV